MARYSIEILDGERRGELLPITERRFTIGRKSSNSLVLNDEKVSGVHAEIVAETGSVVLRDLGSTNGTRIENRKIDEVPLSAGDVIQIGLTRLKLVPANGPVESGSDAADGSDVAQVHRVDASAMARVSRKRVGVPLLLFLALVVAGGGFAYWRFVLSPDAPGVRQGKPALVVAGNLLPATSANLEGESGYEPVAGGATFAASSHANTGTSALETQLTKESAFAAARLKDAVTIAPGQPVTLRAEVAGDPTAVAGARVVFLSSSDGARSLVAGGALRKLEAKYGAFETQVAAPAWADRAAVVLLAAGDGKVFVDDVALLRGGSAKETEAVVHDRRFAEGGGWVHADAAEGPILRAVKPSLPADQAGTPELAGLAASGFLVFADLSASGAPPKLEAADDRMRMSFAGRPGLAVVLVVPAANLSSGRIVVQQEDGRFNFFGDRFEEKAGKGVMVGSRLQQFLATVPEAGRIQCVPQGEDLAISLPCPGGTVEFQVDFVAGTTELLTEMSLAKDAEGRKKLGEAIKHYSAAIHAHPFRAEELEKALKERSVLVDTLRTEIEALDLQISSADFFKTLGGYEEALKAARDLERRFEGAEGTQMAELQKRQESLTAKLEELQGRENKRIADALRAVGSVLEADNRKELAELVKDYVEKHFKGK